MSEALSSQSVPGPRKSTVNVAFASVSVGTRRARYLAQAPVGSNWHEA